MVDREQSRALAARAQHYRERVPVYRLDLPPADQQFKLALSLAGHFWDLIGDCSPVFMPDPPLTTMARMHFPEGGRMNVFTPSGAMEAFVTTAGTAPPLADDESRFDRTPIHARLRETAETLAKYFLREGEELKPERLWETKARGMTMKRETSRTALLAVTGSLRRWVHGLPVLGRASIHVTLGGEQRVTRWGVDWRGRADTAFTDADVVDPDEAAKRILLQLRAQSADGRKEAAAAEPEELTLGYLSMSRRVEQRVLQPAWVARFRPAKGTTMGKIIAIPAGTGSYEPLGFPGRGPSLAMSRR